MASPSKLNFIELAARIRKALNASKELASDEVVPDQPAEYETACAGQSAQPSSDSKSDLDYLFNETGIRVSLTTIEFGKFTYVIRHLASAKRIDKAPSRTQYQLGILLTLVALLAVIIYIFTGKITFGWGAVVYLLAGLSAFVISLTAYWNLKSSHTLIFKDASGSVIHRVMRREKAVIDRLENAVKLAISRSNEHIH